jgi:predicted CoA-binding protein
MGRRLLGLWWVVVVLFAAEALAAEETAAVVGGEPGPRRHAYAAMMYMGTPRDYEFYVATRVMMRSLRGLSAHADRVVIASLDVPPTWVQAL